MLYRNVVILGGGFAGPLMAIAVAPYAEKITLIERFSRSSDEEWLGTPQSQHAHYLTVKGQNLLEKMIPGVLQELRSRGACEIDWGKNATWRNHGGVTPLYDSGVRSLLFSRRLLDRTVFEKAAIFKHLTVLKSAVDRIEFSDLKVQSIWLSDDQVITDADLVIDARGRNARMREKLQEVVGSIPERAIHNDITYYSLSIDHPSDSMEKVQQDYRQPDLSNDGIGYFASPIEGDRCLFTVSHYSGHRPLQPFETLKDHPLLQGKDLSKPRTFGNLSSVHTQYGKSERWISNYLLVGDAVCRLNPIFAHGMTVTLEMAAALQKELQKRDRISTRRLQRQFDSFVRYPWFFVQMDSIRMQKNPAPRGILLLRECIRAMFLTTSTNRGVHLTALRIIQLIDSPWALLSPLFLMRIASDLIFRRWSTLFGDKRATVPTG